MTRLPVRAIAGTLLACATLGACVHSGNARTTDKERSPMTTPSAGNPPETTIVKPKLSAELMLTRLLELIRTSRSLEEFTPERLQEVMGVDIEYAKDGSGRYGFGEAVASKWNQGFEIDLERVHGARFHFSFDPIVPGTYPDMTDVCRIDFDRLSAELVAMTFKREPYYAEHGRLQSYLFGRPGMYVEVFPQGEKSPTAEGGGGRTCVQRILIR